MDNFTPVSKIQVTWLVNYFSKILQVDIWKTIREARFCELRSAVPGCYNVDRWSFDWITKAYVYIYASLQSRYKFQHTFFVLSLCTFSISCILQRSAPGNKAVLLPFNSSPQQRWVFEEHKIFNRFSGECLDIFGEHHHDGAHVGSYVWKDSKNQHWHREYIWISCGNWSPTYHIDSFFLIPSVLKENWRFKLR